MEVLACDVKTAELKLFLELGKVTKNKTNSKNYRQETFFSITDIDELLLVI